MKETKTIFLFSNDAEILAVLDSGYSNSLKLWNVLTNDNWLMHFNKTTGEFESVDDKFSFSTMTCSEIFVIYDGEINDTNETSSNKNKLKLDDIRLAILKHIYKKSLKVHIAFHSKPTKEKQNIIRKTLPGVTEENPLPRHESPSDGFIYSQVYNSLYNLYHNNQQYTDFFGKKVCNVDEMIEIIFGKADKNKSLNEKLEFLHLCLTKKGLEQIRQKELYESLNMKLDFEELEKIDDCLSDEYITKLQDIRNKILDAKEVE